MELAESGSHGDNGNYSLEEAMQGWDKKLTIVAAGAGLSEYTWQYVTKKGNGTVESGAQLFGEENGQKVYKVRYKYDEDNSAAYEYEIELETKDFGAAHIKIDETKYEKGYMNRSGNSAGKITTKVALITTSDEYMFENGDGTKSRTKEIELAWEIEKGELELSGAKWTYTVAGEKKEYPARWNGTTGTWEYQDQEGQVTGSDKGIEWSGNTQTLTLEGLPTGVTAKSYNGNSKKLLGNYTATFEVTYDEANYNAPRAEFKTFAWKIGKKKVVIKGNSWEDKSEGSGEEAYTVPQLKNVQGVTYEYYYLGEESEKPEGGWTVQIGRAHV